MFAAAPNMSAPACDIGLMQSDGIRVAASLLGVWTSFKALNNVPHVEVPGIGELTKSIQQNTSALSNTAIRPTQPLPATATPKTSAPVPKHKKLSSETIKNATPSAKAKQHQ